METIVYLQNFGFDYFEAIRRNLDKIDEVVLNVSVQNSCFNKFLHLKLLFLAPREAIESI